MSSSAARSSAKFFQEEGGAVKTDPTVPRKARTSVKRSESDAVNHIRARSGSGQGSGSSRENSRPSKVPKTSVADSKARDEEEYDVADILCSLFSSQNDGSHGAEVVACADAVGDAAIKKGNSVRARNETGRATANSGVPPLLVQDSDSQTPVAKSKPSLDAAVASSGISVHGRAATDTLSPKGAVPSARPRHTGKDFKGKLGTNSEDKSFGSRSIGPNEMNRGQEGRQETGLGACGPSSLDMTPRGGEAAVDLASHPLLSAPSGTETEAAIAHAGGYQRAAKKDTVLRVGADVGGGDASVRSPSGQPTMSSVAGPGSASHVAKGMAAGAWAAGGNAPSSMSSQASGYYPGSCAPSPGGWPPLGAQATVAAAAAAIRESEVAGANAGAAASAGTLPNYLSAGGQPRWQRPKHCATHVYIAHFIHYQQMHRHANLYPPTHFGAAGAHYSLPSGAPPSTDNGPSFPPPGMYGSLGGQDATPVGHSHGPSGPPGAPVTSHAMASAAQQQQATAAAVQQAVAAHHAAAAQHQAHAAAQGRPSESERVRAAGGAEPPRSSSGQAALPPPAIPAGFNGSSASAAAAQVAQASAYAQQVQAQLALIQQSGGLGGLGGFPHASHFPMPAYPGAPLQFPGMPPQQGAQYFGSPYSFPGGLPPPIAPPGMMPPSMHRPTTSSPPPTGEAHVRTSSGIDDVRAHEAHRLSAPPSAAGVRQGGAAGTQHAEKNADAMAAPGMNAHPGMMQPYMSREAAAVMMAHAAAASEGRAGAPPPEGMPGFGPVSPYGSSESAHARGTLAEQHAAQYVAEAGESARLRGMPAHLAAMAAHHAAAYMGEAEAAALRQAQVAQAAQASQQQDV
mmetsp:Transcript_21653/g.41321  ORF Transcript_21653/g.41321 Transcript_21653/m.41321 type:complete len:852 (+) Transcript_21653:333-2888(+)